MRYKRHGRSGGAIKSRQLSVELLEPRRLLSVDVNDIVAYRLAVTDLAGSPITQAEVGGTVQLRGYVQDIRGVRAAGVFASYTDVVFTHPDLVSLRSGETQRLSLEGERIGTFRLSLNGQRTTPISLEGDVGAALQAALETLPNVGLGNVLVLPDFGGYQIKFRGALGEQNISPLIVDGSGTTTAVTVTDNAYPADPSELLSAVTMGYNGYFNGKGGQLEGAGLWSDVGAFSNFFVGPPNGPGQEYLLFTADLHAEAAGTLEFHGQVADGLGRETLLFDFAKITPSQIGFRDPVTLTIVDTRKPVVTVDGRITNDTTPTITGTVNEGTLQVTLNGRTYTAGDGNLTVVGTDWTLQVPATDALAAGTYNVAATATDGAGNVGGDDGSDELVVDTAAPVADIVDVSPDPRSSAVGLVKILFTEAVSGVDLSDFGLTRNGTRGDLTGVPFVRVNASEYTLDLTTVTAETGNYEFQLAAAGAGIHDVAGNALVGAVREAWTIEAPGPAFQNPHHPCDVTGDGKIGPIDVLTLITDINRWGARELSTAAPPTPASPPFLDPTGDGWIGPVDVLTVIRDIDTYGARPVPTASGGEGEDDGRIDCFGFGAVGFASTTNLAAGLDSSPSAVVVSSSVQQPLWPTSVMPTSKTVMEQFEPLMSKDGYFCLRADQKSNGPAAFRALYRAKAVTRIGDRVAYYQEKMGVAPKSVRVLDLKNRWASCSADDHLNFHWKCMMAPTTILDYIAVHELAHLRYPNHTAAFWNEVDKVMPDYRERKEWLRVNGAGMDL